MIGHDGIWGRYGQVYVCIFLQKRKEDRVGTHRVYLVGKPLAGPEFLGFENSDDMFAPHLKTVS